MITLFLSTKDYAQESIARTENWEFSALVLFSKAQILSAKSSHFVPLPLLAFVTLSI